MLHLSTRLTCLTLVLAVAACGGDVDERDAAAAPGAAVLMTLPVTSPVAEASEHFMAGQRDLDMGRGIQANTHFRQAVEADGSMAFAYLRAAQTAGSFAEYRALLEQAEAAATNASEAEQLLIRIERSQFDGNQEGALAAAQELVNVVPESPRAWLTLAAVQTGLNRVADARASMQRAIEAAPEFAAAHMQLANSLMLSQPLDPAAAQQHAQHAVELEPDEPFAHDILGDAHRGAGNLEAARAAYDRSAEVATLDMQKAAALQQRGHVNSFLGNYDEARSDYDRAIALAEGNARAAFGQWRAFVNLHAGDPQAAIAELNALADAIDGMGIPEPTGVKIATLTQAAVVALYADRVADAEAALSRRTELVRRQIEEVGTDEFRRFQEAVIAYYDGRIALEKGQYDVANANARTIMELRAPDNDPRKDELAHNLMGSASLAQGDYAAALEHLTQGNTNGVYNQYERALAHEGLGQTAEARALYQGIVDNRFNNVNTAMLRAIAIEKTS